MRWVLLALVAAAAGPPVIHEPFTPLPCPIHPDTTIDVEGCQEVRVLRTDRAIDGEVGKIFRLVRTQSARSSFVDGERSWLHYRRASCLAEASVSAGGSNEAVGFLNCTLRRNTSHLADLTAMRTTLTRH